MNFQKISRFSDSAPQDGTDSWDPLGGGGWPPGGRQLAREAAESGPGHRQRSSGTQAVRNDHRNPLDVPTGDAG